MNQYDLVIDTKPAGSEDWVETLQNRPKDKPFFMWFASHDAHRPWQATKGKHAIAKPHSLDEVTVPPYFPDTPEVRQDLAEYYDEIHRLDDYTGCVLTELEKQGVSDNTMVVFISDNGRAFPTAKTRVIDSGIKTPFLIHWPKAKFKIMDRNQLVSSIDILPTFLEMAGLKVPVDIQGRSFVQMLEKPNEKIHEYIFAEHNWHDYKAHERMVRSLDYIYSENAFPELSANPPADGVRSPTFQTMLKLNAEGKLTEKQQACFVVPRPATELYNVINDPFSFDNLVNDERYSAKSREMKAALEKWQKQTADHVPVNPKEDSFHRITGKKLKDK
jgi:arylsulfatase A-like enzyme